MIWIKGGTISKYFLIKEIDHLILLFESIDFWLEDLKACSRIRQCNPLQSCINDQRRTRFINSMVWRLVLESSDVIFFENKVSIPRFNKSCLPSFLLSRPKSESVTTRKPTNRSQSLTLTNQQKYSININWTAKNHKNNWG